MVDVKRLGDMIISIKFVVDRETFNVISAYAPQVGLEEHHKIKFWEDLESLVQGIPLEEKIFLGGDLNGHVGKDASGYEGLHGGYGVGVANAEGKTILDFSLAFDFTIANSCFRKREEHLITYKSGQTCSQIDFFLIRKSDRKLCTNCKVIPGESLTTQHMVLVMDVRFSKRMKRNNQEKIQRIKWWQLKGEKQSMFQRRVMEEVSWEAQGSANELWDKMAEGVKNVAKETLGESTGFGLKGKESWWWDASVQDKVKAKKGCFKTYSLGRNAKNWEKYKTTKRETKKEVSEARARAFDGLYQSLDTKAGERGIYKLAKGRERRTRDLDQVKCIKDDEGKVLVTEHDINVRWKNYFQKLFNEGHESPLQSDRLYTREEDQNFTFCRRIRET